MQQLYNWFFKLFKLSIKEKVSADFCTVEI